jgi:hypothetical protein
MSLSETYGGTYIFKGFDLNFESLFILYNRRLFLSVLDLYDASNSDYSKEMKKEIRLLIS